MRRVALSVLAILVLGSAGCGDEIEIKGRLVAAGDGPGFSNATYALDAYSFGDAWEDVVATGTLDEDGRFDIAASRPDVSELGFALWVNSPNSGAQVTLYIVDDVVDLGEIAVWNPDLRVDVDDTGVVARWSPPPADLQGRVSGSLGDISLDPAEGQASAPGWKLEDRGYPVRLRWESDLETESLQGLTVSAVEPIGPLEPSAAAGAPCYVYRYDSYLNRQVDVLIEPCLLTDRDDETGVDMKRISNPRGVFVDLGSSLPISHVVVRTKDAAQGGRVLLADEGAEPQLVGMLDSTVTGLDLPTPVVAHRVLVETPEPATIIDIAAFTPDE